MRFPDIVEMVVRWNTCFVVCVYINISLLVKATSRYASIFISWRETYNASRCLKQISGTEVFIQSVFKIWHVQWHPPSNDLLQHLNLLSFRRDLAENIICGSLVIGEETTKFLALQRIHDHSMAACENRLRNQNFHSTAKYSY